jgi:class 3 adenylate cyclase
VTVVGVPLLVANGASPAIAATGLLLFGLILGGFEEFYFQAGIGEGMRSMHPVLSLPILIAVTLAIAVVAVSVNLVLWGAVDRIDEALANLFARLHLVALLTIGLVLSLRVISFVGGRTVLGLLTGRYHRPVEEMHVLAFLDINGSTALVERLGLLKGREAINRMVSRLSRLVIEYDGDVYTFTGDGLIGIWTWNAAVRNANILDFARSALAAIRELEPEFVREYSFNPSIRIGIHGGKVVVSQEGDIRRAIGIWGDVINIAARLEQAGRSLQESCIISRAVVAELGVGDSDLEPLAAIHADGITQDVAAYALRPDSA